MKNIINKLFVTLWALSIISAHAVSVSDLDTSKVNTYFNGNVIKMSSSTLTSAQSVWNNIVEQVGEVVKSSQNKKLEKIFGNLKYKNGRLFSEYIPKFQNAKGGNAGVRRTAITSFEKEQDETNNIIKKLNKIPDSNAKKLLVALTNFLIALESNVASDFATA